ncbi:hypothetical protein KY289_001517 [Solanum tuberosum]|nr:hypothetical protein KY289_001517 [Solanum tuberosum]
MLGNNLPSHNDVIQPYKSRNIKRLRLYEPNHEVLQALRGSNIEVMLGIPNSDVKHIASSGEHARWWVEKNVRAFYPDVVGNGISPFTDTSHLTSHLETAMSRIYNSVYFTGLGYNVNVTTSIDMTLMGKSYPPSQAVADPGFRVRGCQINLSIKLILYLIKLFVFSIHIINQSIKYK